MIRNIYNWTRSLMPLDPHKILITFIQEYPNRHELQGQNGRGEAISASTPWLRFSVRILCWVDQARDYPSLGRIICTLTSSFLHKINWDKWL